MSYEQATLIALLLGPVTAVLITLWYQDRQQKRAAKERLFITLMAHRKSLPPTIEWANALNLIDVVFVDHPKVVAAWHDLYDYVHVKPIDQRQFDQKNLLMLSVMGDALGYKIPQIDIEKFYKPKAHGDQAAMSADLQAALLTFLKQIASAVQKNTEDQAKK